MEGLEDEGCGRPAAFFAELRAVSGERCVGAGGVAHCAVLCLGGRRGEGTGVEGTDCGGEGRELYHWAEACRGHGGVWWYTTAGVSVKSTRRDCSRQ